MGELALPESEVIQTLKNSLYPNASEQSIGMVLSYCKASDLDPMQKPVHIVPMWDSQAQRMRDVVMPGIGLYRTQAARSGQYGGISEPEFGQDITETIGGQNITYPASCKVTVFRLVAGNRVGFSATERWKENYAMRGGKQKSIAPNAMWTRRPYAQLAKCAEAQALRKAFPEFGAQPTYEEMEGKQDEFKEIDITPTNEQEPTPLLPVYPQERFDQMKSVWLEKIQNGLADAEHMIAMISSKNHLTEDQKQQIRDLENENS